MESSQVTRSERLELSGSGRSTLGVGEISGKSSGRLERSCSIAQHSWEMHDRFSLLLLEEGEYYFMDFMCHYHPTKNGHRVAGHLKLCSNSVFFVPRNVMEPIFRIPFASTLAIDRVQAEDRPPGAGEVDEFLQVSSSERVDMKMGNRNVPYICHKGNFNFQFSLVNSESFSSVLEKGQALFQIVKGPSEQRYARVAAIVKEHEDSLPFNPTWLEEGEVAAMELVANRVSPLVSHPGRVVATRKHLYFQPFNVVSSSPVQIFELADIDAVMPRTFNLEPVGLEIFFKEMESAYFTFKSESQRDQFHSAVLLGAGAGAGAGRSWTRAWQRGQVSNYDYLMWLNRQAERSFNDLTQYPVFPWVIADYHSPTLDLKNQRTFRDLSKPIGALNPKRLEMCKRRFVEMVEANVDLENDNPMKTPPFLYGCHYSTPGFVVYYLLRKDPQLMLRLQNGKFDMADRLLWSIAETFNSVYTNPTDLKELTPEFFTQPPTFLVNHEGLDFGQKQSGQRVDSVELPPWASTPADFIHKMRQALECEHVSRNLHKWIDLTFGYKQRGQHALEADNVFHFLTYDDLGRAQLQKVEDPHLKRAIKLQMMEFGRMPKQLFVRKHPSRKHPSSATWRRLISCLAPAPAPGPGPGPGPGPDRLVSAGKSAESAGAGLTLHQAMKRICYSHDAAVRAAAVRWLEQESQALDPAAAQARLSLGEPGSNRYTELLPIVAMCRSSDIKKQNTAVRVMHALANSKVNCKLILNAGALEPVVDVLCGASPDSAEVCTFLIHRLVEVESPLLANFNMSALAALLELLQESTELVRQAAIFAIFKLTYSELNRTNVLGLGGLAAVVKLLQGRHSVETRALAAECLINLTVDDDTKYQLVELGGLQLLIEMCEQVKPLQIVAVQCMAVLSTNDRLKLEIAARGGLRLLSAASCAGDADLQQAAADAVANMCTDTNIINAVVKEEGLWSVIAMAQSPHNMVQRHAARAFWHLAMHCENKQQIMEMGGLQTLVRLSMLCDDNPQATLLAEEALVKLSEDQAVKDAIERESLNVGKYAPGEEIDTDLVEVMDDDRQSASNMPAHDSDDTGSSLSSLSACTGVAAT